MKGEAEKYFEMATANTKETRPTVSSEECLALMRDFANQEVLKWHEVIGNFIGEINKLRDKTK